MSFVPPLVDAIGNFNPHYQEGMKVPVRDLDVNGVEIDISLRTWTFKTASGLTKQLVADPNNAKGKLLVLTTAEVQGIPAVGTDFAIVDETTDPDDVRWEGRITPRGWK